MLSSHQWQSNLRLLNYVTNTEVHQLSNPLLLKGQDMKNKQKKKQDLL